MAPRFGVIGVCACISATYLLRSFANQVVYVKILHIDLGRFYLDCHGRMLPGLALAFAASHVMVRFFLNGIPFLFGWSGFLLKAICVAVVYAVAMWLIGWNDFEKSMMKSLVLGIKRH